MRRVPSHRVLGTPHQGALSCHSRGCGGACPFSPLQPMLQGALLAVLIAGKAPCLSVGRERSIISLSVFLASAADSCRPILMSSVNADGSPAYINAVFASVRLRPP